MEPVKAEDLPSREAPVPVVDLELEDRWEQPAVLATLVVDLGASVGHLAPVGAVLGALVDHPAQEVLAAVIGLVVVSPDSVALAWGADRGRLPLAVDVVVDVVLGRSPSHRSDDRARVLKRSSQHSSRPMHRRRHRSQILK